MGGWAELSQALLACRQFMDPGSYRLRGKLFAVFSRTITRKMRRAPSAIGNFCYITPVAVGPATSAGETWSVGEEVEEEEVEERE